jgi:hypothetical protein
MIRSSLIEQGKRASLMSVLLSVLLAFAYAPLARFYGNQVEAWILNLGWAALGVNILRTVLSHLYKLDRLPFRRFDLVLTADTARPGEPFRLEVHCEARRGVIVGELSSTLEGINQSLTEKAGNGRRLHHEMQVMAEKVALRPGETRRFLAALPVPVNAPTSYKDPERRIRWRIVVKARVPDWGDLRDEFEVTVEPR